MFLESRNVGLRPIEREDLAQMRDWRNDPEVRESFREFRPLNMQNQEKWFESLKDGRNIMFAIEKKPKRYGAFIGVCGLCYVDQHNRSAEISYYVGDKRWGGKYDKEIIRLLLKYGFEELGLHRIHSESYVFAADRSIEDECGFKREGVRRDVVFRHGRFWNSVTFSILEDEWK